MTQLSEQTSGYKDSQGKFHDTKDKADLASAQQILNKANPGGSISIQSLINLYAINPELWEMVNRLYEERRETLRKQNEEQLGVNPSTEPVK